jgi:hypothetical protein
MLRKAGAVAYKSGRCGLHVHVSHPYYNTDTNAFKNRIKLRMFMAKCKSPVIKFSCRHKRGLDYARFEDVNALKVTRYDTEHMYAMNTQNGSRTVEFRIFRGTLDQARFTASLQFADAVTDFCMLHGHAFIYAQSGAVIWSTFVRFIRSRAKWGKLYAQLVKQGIAQ